MPIVLEGEGHYALNLIKDIKVTEEFLGLGQEITRCQTREFRADCVSRRYQEQVLASCHCAPLYIRQHFPHQVPLTAQYKPFNALGLLLKRSTLSYWWFNPFYDDYFLM